MKEVGSGHCILVGFLALLIKVLRHLGEPHLYIIFVAECSLLGFGTSSIFSPLTCSIFYFCAAFIFPRKRDNTEGMAGNASTSRGS